jgi:hypothetical protein
VGAQIAAACNTLQAAGTLPTAKLVLAALAAGVYVQGALVALNPTSASCGVSHWRKAQGKLRTKGQAVATTAVATPTA